MVKRLSNFSVIIRTKNEEQWVGHAIQSVLDHLYKPEIIIVDNNSTDKTLEIVNQFAEDPLLNGDSKKYTKVKIFNIKDYSPGKALNFVLRKVQKNILIISATLYFKQFSEIQVLKLLKKHVDIRKSNSRL